MSFYDRRQYERIKLNQPVRYELKNSRKFKNCMSCDISQNGLRIKVEDFIPLGTELIIQAQIALEKMVEFLGRVVWIQQNPHSETYQAGLVICEQESTQEPGQQIRELLHR